MLYLLLVLISATLFALLEIQIEGKDGWAKKLPTWRIKFIGMKDLTGYHLYLWLFLFSFIHVVFLFTEWTIGKEMYLASFYFITLLLEDFLWFIFNPYYGIKKFNRKTIMWHPYWIGPLPAQYYFFLLLWYFLYYYSKFF